MAEIKLLTTTETFRELPWNQKAKIITHGHHEHLRFIDISVTTLERWAVWCTHCRLKVLNISCDAFRRHFTETLHG